MVDANIVFYIKTNNNNQAEFNLQMQQNSD